MKWKDNCEHHLLTENVEKLLAVAKPPISFLDDKRKSLLVFPLSFQESEDCIGQQHLFDIAPKENDYVVKTGNLAGFISLNKMYVTISSRFDIASA